MGNLIQFPKRNDKIKGVKTLTSSVSVPLYVVIGLVGLFVFSIVFNVSVKSKASKTRDLANYGSSNSAVNIDDYILKSLRSSDESIEVVYSKKLTIEDKFVFETLMGSYDVLKTNGKITSVELKSGYKSLSSKLLPQVLEQFSLASGFKSTSYKLINQDKSLLKYSLIEKDTPLAEVSILIGESSDIISIKTTYK
jgi:hypothetical protein